MIARPVMAGALAGGVLAIAASVVVLAPALDRRTQAGAAQSRLEQALDRAPVAPLAEAQETGSAQAAVAATLAVTRRSAAAAGVLVERATPATPAAPHVARLAMRLSGPEKAVLSLADGIVRGVPGAQWRSWRLTALPGGALQLDGEMVLAWR
ncbi:hypothetical protein [Sphingomonas baiyangensis]|uniref:General secretion pathway protein GspM n=1 Tax=Sphingomonas baiyangensis TaxID=2572576 RepID=A0A4U1L838_9SPHN|nr:hypothetical protein [Sphingomonas baiyangensis]TKD53121.1 hypothetical protein FBR43_01935 [Sphingomonas baiyangensis]